MDTERARFLEVLDGLEVDEAAVERLRDASRRVDDLRFADKVPPAEHGRVVG
jgi:hypothetical protein